MAFGFLKFFFYLYVMFSDLYWKNEHRLMCTSEVCTAAERDRYEKSVSSLNLLSLGFAMCSYPMAVSIVAGDHWISNYAAYFIVHVP